MRRVPPTPRAKRQFRTYDTSYIRPKRSKAPLVFAAVLAVVVVGGLAWGALTLFNSCSGSAPVGAPCRGPGGHRRGGRRAPVPRPSGSRLVQRARLVGTCFADFAKRVTELGVESPAQARHLHVRRRHLPRRHRQPDLPAGPRYGQRRVLDHPRRATRSPNIAAARVADGLPEGRITAEAFAAAATDASVYAARLPASWPRRGTELRSRASCSPRPTRWPSDATADSLVRMMLDPVPEARRPSLDCVVRRKSQGLYHLRRP